MSPQAEREMAALERVKACEVQARTIRARIGAVQFSLVGLRNMVNLHPDALDKGPDALFRALAEADGALRHAENLIEDVRKEAQS